MKRCKSCGKQVSGSHYCSKESRTIYPDDTSFIVNSTLYTDTSSSYDSSSSSSSSSSDTSSSFDGGSSGGFDGGGSSGSW